jgi:hypothetical protein
MRDRELLELFAALAQRTTTIGLPNSIWDEALEVLAEGRKGA